MSVSAAPRIVVRTVASPTVGAGHLKRCLSLALRLRTLGAQVAFVLPAAPPPFDAWIRDRGFSMHEIGEALSSSADAENSLAVLPGCDWVVVDDYELDAHWHEVAAERHVRVVVIDDLGNRPLRADVLVDPNEHDDPGAKHAKSLLPLTRLLSGSRYALLDPAYESARRYEFHPRVRSVGIFMGATDPGQASALVLKACRRVFEGPIEVVSTSANQRLHELSAAVRSDHSAELKIDLPDLAAFHARHDLQIGASGGATWERCCIGAPALAMSLADNQDTVLPTLARRGIVAAFDGPPSACQELSLAIQMLIDDPDRRESLAARSRETVDGRGALRVALAMLATRLEVRLAGPAECDLILAWRNHPAVRVRSLQSEPISKENHRRWYAESLESPNRLLLIGRVGSRAVGVVRFDAAPQRHAASVSIHLDPALLGLALGPVLLARGQEALRAAWPSTTQIRADVVPGNTVSIRMFRNAGYDGEAPLLTKQLI